jgi:hypothetical protein
MLRRKFHRNNVLWIVGFVLVHTAVIRNIVLPMRPWLSLPNRAMDPLLFSLVKCLQAGSGIRCSTLTLNTSQAAGTKKTLKDMIERPYRSLKNYHRYLNLVLPQKGPALPVGQYWKRITGKMSRACKEPKTKGHFYDFAASEQAHSFCLESQIFWEPCFWANARWIASYYMLLPWVSVL